MKIRSIFASSTLEDSVETIKEQSEESLASNEEQKHPITIILVYRFILITAVTNISYNSGTLEICGLFVNFVFYLFIY